VWVDSVWCINVCIDFPHHLVQQQCESTNDDTAAPSWCPVDLRSRVSTPVTRWRPPWLLSKVPHADKAASASLRESVGRVILRYSVGCDATVQAWVDRGAIRCVPDQCAPATCGVWRIDGDTRAKQWDPQKRAYELAGGG